MLAFGIVTVKFKAREEGMGSSGKDMHEKFLLEF